MSDPRPPTEEEIEEAKAFVAQKAAEARAREEAEALKRKPPSREQIEDHHYRR
jgi:hypothetical protein